jgi:hypothetical protein
MIFSSNFDESKVDKIRYQSVNYTSTQQQQWMTDTFVELKPTDKEKFLHFLQWGLVS